MAERIDCVVIGAGVVGLAVARALGRAGREVLVLEADESIGTGISARSSEVIHSGIYYPAGSAKARLCVEGRRLLYDYCRARGIAHRRCGKLIVATQPDERSRLQALESAGRANGVTDLRWIEADEARALEPALRCVAALESPSSGIIDSHALMVALQGDLARAGGSVACRSPVLEGRPSDGGLLLRAGAAAAPDALIARLVINCAGLGAQEVARRLGTPSERIPPLHYAKGSYFQLQGRCPFTRLIYPLPEPGGLGVHLTLDLAGRARFGPDVEWVEQVDFAVDPERAAHFYPAIRRYWPELPDAALRPAYAGVRPKLAGPEAPVADFAVQGPGEHGIARLVNLYGIESPGLTAALAIAETVATLVQATS